MSLTVILLHALFLRIMRLGRITWQGAQCRHFAAQL